MYHYLRCYFCKPEFEWTWIVLQIWLILNLTCNPVSYENMVQHFIHFIYIHTCSPKDLLYLHYKYINILALYTYIISHKWSTTHRLLKLHLLHLGTWCTVPQSHCGDNQEDTLFSWLHIYITNVYKYILYIYMCSILLLSVYINK